MNKFPKTRLEAITLKSKYYFDNKPCFRNHNAPRYTCNGTCIECSKRWSLPKKQRKKRPEKILDLSKRSFGKWTVSDKYKREITKFGNKRTLWWCKCKCGNEKWVGGGSLVAGTSQGCRKCSEKENGLKKAIRYGYVPGKPRLMKTKWTKIINGAKRRNLKISISRKDALELLQKQECKCALTGWPIHLPERTGGPNSTGTASLDRVNNSMGYIKGNVQWLHWTINKMKSTLSELDFIKACKAVANFNSNV